MNEALNDVGIKKIYIYMHAQVEKVHKMTTTQTGQKFNTTKNKHKRKNIQVLSEKQNNKSNTSHALTETPRDPTEVDLSQNHCRLKEIRAHSSRHVCQCTKNRGRAVSQSATKICEGKHPE